jgi:AraC family transcriptional regulator of adaptative response / DNA-3-methyladenine glycosylase II
MELPGKDVCYRALECRDARFDGLIFVGIKSTGVYCRPVCPARTPKFQNCFFYPSAAAAQDAGYRPCLRCRPETAPEMASWHGTSSTVSRALALIAEGALDGDHATVEDLAMRLGMGERQLRSLFLRHLGASPISVAQTRRVLFAKQLLHDTRMPMASVAAASGFGSVRRFNEVFQKLYDRPPAALRRSVSPDGSIPAAEGVTLLLRYKPPYDWDSILRFFAQRAVPGVEVVEDGKYFRTVEINGQTGSIEVSHDPKHEGIRVRILFPNVRAFPAIAARGRRQFDTGADIRTIEAHLSNDPLLAPFVARHPGLRAPGGWDGFELAVRAVLGQQISVAAARKLAAALVVRYGHPVRKNYLSHPDLHRVFPAAKDLARTAAIDLPMPAARLAALKAVAEASAADPNLFRSTGSIDSAIQRLKHIRGIGEWSAQYIALRAIREMDAFPATDVGLLRGAAALDAATAASPDLLLERAEAWRPWRAYAAQHLWSAAPAVPSVKAPASHRRNTKDQSLTEKKDRVMDLVYKVMPSPVGKLKLIASQTGITAILWENDPPRRVRLENMVRDDRNPLLLEAERQLREYFAGKRQSFSLPLDPRGTAFQKNVWTALLSIPFGETRTYGELARQLGTPTASRAVGAASGRNPLSILVPCHRVIGSTGKLTGFAGGLDAKAYLLRLEASY